MSDAKKLNAQVIKFLRELIERMEDERVRVNMLQVRDHSTTFEPDHMAVINVLTGDRTMVLKWYDASFDNRAETVHEYYGGNDA